MVFWCCDPLEPLSPEETSDLNGKVGDEILVDNTTEAESSAPEERTDSGRTGPEVSDTLVSGECTHF